MTTTPSIRTVYPDPGGGDDTAFLQSEINRLDATTGGQLEFRPGVYSISSTLTITNPNVNLVGVGWDQTTLSVGSVLKATGSMTDIINVSSAGERFRMANLSFDGGGLATNCVTVDALNCQISECYARRPASNGTGFNITANGTSIWFQNCRFNGANQTGVLGFVINGTDSIMQGCKAVNCVDAVQYLGGASGAIQTASHHTPGSPIGRCAINIVGNPSNIQIVANRIDNHVLGSAIQISPTSNVLGFIINSNLFFQNTITDATFAAIGVDTTSANIRQLAIVGNVVRSAASHNYSALLTAQTLAGAAATNPTRISTAGTIASGNHIYAAAAFGASSTPLAARGNVLTTDGATFSAVVDT